jgi:cytochrome c556
MLRTVLAVAAIVGGVTIVAAQSDPIQERNGLMTSLWREGFAIPFRMSRGQEPFDAAKLDASLVKMSEIVAKLPPLWPPNSKPPANPKSKYSSSPKIWDNKPDFDAKLAALTKAISESRGKAKNADELKEVVGRINRACDDCHERYQVRNQ